MEASGHPTSVRSRGAEPVSAPEQSSESRAWSVVKAYVALTKPRIIELLLITTLPVMFLADGGVPGLGLVLATMLGGTLSAGSANALNCVLDRDIDEKMRRTRRRPLPRHSVGPRNATIFGIALGVVSTLWLGLAVNWLSSALALAANLFYVFGYTMVLKRRTTRNVVWGGAAGCFPTVIGWTAVTNSLDWAPFVLFAVVFFWTPPHTWALAFRYREDYAAADVPMLPVVETAPRVAAEICWYTYATVATTLLLVPVAGMSWCYAASASVLGLWFIAESHLLLKRAKAGARDAALHPMRLFHMSNVYLMLVFVAVALDPVLVWR